VTRNEVESIERRLSELEPAARALEESPAERVRITERVVAFANEMLEGLSSRKAWAPGEGARQELIDRGIPEQPANLDALMDLVVREVDGPGLQPASGGHLGYIAGGGLYASALGDYMAAVTNLYAGVHYACPGAVHLENLMVRWLCKIIGYPDGALGTLTSGGSIATLIAVVAARDASQLGPEHWSRISIYLSDQTHHCVAKAIAIAGMGQATLRRVHLDEGHRMISEHLAQLVREDRAAGMHPLLVVASAGTTDAGALDPLDDIAEIASRESMWFHVDAAYGGAFLLLDTMRGAFRGIERADSVVIDPHKGLFLPYGTGALLVKDPKHLAQSHGMRGIYLQDAEDHADEPSPSDLSPELTRHFRGLRFWLPLQLHGLARFRAALEEKLLLARLFYVRAQALGFEVGPEPDLSVVMFRWTDVPAGRDPNEFNRKLLATVLADGRVFLSSTSIGGVFWLRVAVLSFRSHREQVDIVLEIIERETRNFET